MVKLVSTNYRRSPLVQGGLEIPAKITVTLPGTVRNHLLIDKYKQIVTENYAEPKKEEILARFWLYRLNLYESLKNKSQLRKSLQKKRKERPRAKTSESCLEKSLRRTRKKIMRCIWPVIQYKKELS